MIRYVLMDIEGTTTPISFVHDVLFPFASAHLDRYIAEQSGEAHVKACLDDVIATIKEETSQTISASEAVTTLHDWIATDRKHPALKTLQGHIWEAGYQSGTLRSQVYADVPEALTRWREQGLRLGIYSSGSIKAQKLLFGHTDYGDLNPMLSEYFDTGVGAKREAASYQNILAALALSGDEVAFLSDVPAELDAAREQQIRTVQLVRPGTDACAQHQTVADFTELDFR